MASSLAAWWVYGARYEGVCVLAALSICRGGKFWATGSLHQVFHHYYPERLRHHTQTHTHILTH